jgi:tetratricopeptide (TPR) repeat protein
VKQQIFLTTAGIVLITVLFLFGSIELQKSSFPHAQQTLTATFKITDSIQKARQSLTSSQILYVTNLENSIKRGDVKQQSHNNFIHLANFWKDSVKSFLPYAYYLSEASKLDNSEKSLTFAARLILDSMRREENEKVREWESETAIVLFEKAIRLNSDNEDLKVDLGSCYVYGKGMSGNAAETMKGIQQLLSVVAKDSNNMKAQMILGIGGVISKQYDKAIMRLNKVVVAQPGNLEAISWLADVYAETGDKVNAIKWYEYSKKLVNNQKYSNEVNIRIKALQ